MGANTGTWSKDLDFQLSLRQASPLRLYSSITFWLGSQAVAPGTTSSMHPFLIAFRERFQSTSLSCSPPEGCVPFPHLPRFPPRIRLHQQHLLSLCYHSYLSLSAPAAPLLLHYNFGASAPQGDPKIRPRSRWRFRGASHERHRPSKGTWSHQRSLVRTMEVALYNNNRKPAKNQSTLAVANICIYKKNGGMSNAWEAEEMMKTNEMHKHRVVKKNRIKISKFTRKSNQTNDRQINASQIGWPFLYWKRSNTAVRQACVCGSI